LSHATKTEDTKSISVNGFKNALDKIRKTTMGFFED